MREQASFRTTSHLLGLVTLVGRLIQEELGHRLQRTGLTFAQAVALVRLWRSPEGAVLQADMIKSLTVSRALGSQLLGDLEDMGLVKRRPDTIDARRQLVALTPAGRELESGVLRIFDDVEDELLADCEKADKEDARSVLRVMLDRSRVIRTDRM